MHKSQQQLQKQESYYKVKQMGRRHVLGFGQWRRRSRRVFHTPSRSWRGRLSRSQRTSWKAAHQTKSDSEITWEENEIQIERSPWLREESMKRITIFAEALENAMQRQRWGAALVGDERTGARLGFMMDLYFVLNRPIQMDCLINGVPYVRN